MEILRHILRVKEDEGFFRVLTDGPELRVVFVTDEILRVRASFDRAFREESYVLMTTAWEDRLDPLFAGERVRVTPAAATLTEMATGYAIESAALRLELDRGPACLRLYDREGALLWSALPGCPFTRDRNGRVTAYSRMEEDDCFYGFGEKTGPLNKNQCRLRERATDAMGYDPTRCDTLYKHIPYYLHLNRESKKAVGLFYHNFFESEFNMGCEKSNYRPRYSYFRADGGDLDLFLIGGNSIARIVDNYTRLTGRPALLPKRALGYQGSSMYYAELPKDCDRAVLAFADTAEREGFPLDGFHLSSGYTTQEGKRCVFTWSRERFPDPEGFLNAMEEKGAPCAANVKPGVLLSHPRFAEWAAQGVFVCDSRDETKPALDAWWGGDGALWDFTNPKAREVWKACLREALLDCGPAEIWNDNCEYDSLLDQDARCDFDGAGGTLAALKPVMATLMSKLTCDAIREQGGDRRPYVVCRAGSAGIQRYAQTWCGDNCTSWESLRGGIPILMGMGLSGQPNEGADVGGFAGPAPEEELFVRWVQNGVFMPRFSIHSANSDNTVTEPWMYSGTKALVRGAMALRFRLWPYLYAAEWEAHETGAPILRPLVYEFQNDARVYDEDGEFLFGRDLLVANVLEPGAKTRRVYLPAGCRWYDWNDNYRRYEGGREIEVPVTLATIPLFVREGAVIPMADDAPTRLGGSHVKDLRLLIAPGREARSYALYDDDGETMAYTRGVCRKTEITVSGTDTVTVAFRAEGDFPDTAERVTVELLCPERSPLSIALGGDPLPRFLDRDGFEAAERGWYYSQTKRAALIRYPNPRRDLTLTLCFDAHDVIGM